MRARRWMWTLALVGLLCAGPAGARDEEADTEAPADEAAGKCVAACESGHAACVAEARTRAADCDRQKATCDRGCATCTQMSGPLVVYCVSDCEQCRARLASSACGKAPPSDADCQPALDACLERCGP